MYDHPGYQEWLEQAITKSKYIIMEKTKAPIWIQEMAPEKKTYYVSEEQTIEIIIVDRLGNTVFQTNVITTESGEFDLLWRAPPESLSGTYSVIVTDIFEKTITSTFDL